MANLSLSRPKPFAIEATVKPISSQLINKIDQHTVTMFYSIILEEEDMREVSNMGPTKKEEIIRGEVIWDSNNENGGGAGNWVSDSGGRGKVAEQMGDPSKF